MFRAAIILAVPLFAMPHAFAAEPSRAFASCMDSSGGVTMSMLECLATENARVDDALNMLWQDKLPAQDEALKQKLRASQRAWIAYRDATCDVAAGLYEGGSLAGVTYGDCQRDITTDRLEWLTDIFTQLAAR